MLCRYAEAWMISGLVKNPFDFKVADYIISLLQVADKKVNLHEHW